jgi:ABC transporter substrate binding protein
MKKASAPSILVAMMLLAVGVTAQAQQPKKVSRLGYLSNTDAATDSARAEGIRLALRERGYIEGQNIAIEYRYAEGKVDRAPELAAELVRLKVDIIVVASGDQWIRAAKNATKTIPIVMMGQGSDPVRAGLVESLARPGGNVTGLTALARELGGKRLELLKEAVPKLSRVAVLYDPASPPSLHEMKLLPSSSCFPLISEERLDNPVMFPPGRARLATNPFPTGSLSNAMTMGIVTVASLATRVTVGPAETMMSTLSRTSSAASAGRRSSFPSAHRCSMTMLFPST